MIDNRRADKEGLICSSSPVTPHLRRRHIDVSFKVWAFHYHLIHSERWPINHTRAESKTCWECSACGSGPCVCVYSSLMCLSVWPGGDLGFMCAACRMQGWEGDGEWEEEKNVWISRHLTERKRQNIVCVCVCVLPERVMGLLAFMVVSDPKMSPHPPLNVRSNY